MEPARKREKQHTDKKKKRRRENEREREALVTVKAAPSAPSRGSQCAVEAGNCLIAHILAVHYKVRVGPLTLLTCIHVHTHIYDLFSCSKRCLRSQAV